MLVGNQFATDFSAKANLFNNYFSQQCTARDTDSSVKVWNLQKLSTFEFYADGIIKIIKSLNPNKAHGHDKLSIRMIKLCASSIQKTFVSSP